MSFTRKQQSNIRTLTIGQVADTIGAVAAEIHRTYVEMGKLLRRLENYKRRHGICTCGMSCMKLAVGKSRGGRVLWCSKHDRKKRKGEPVTHHRYITPYGLAILAERVREREAKRKGKKYRKAA